MDVDNYASALSSATFVLDNFFIVFFNQRKPEQREVKAVKINLSKKKIVIRKKRLQCGTGLSSEFNKEMCVWWMENY